MKSIYILLTKSDTWVSRIIKLATDDKYTHASISFEENLQPLYSLSRKFVNMPLPADLRTEPLTKVFFRSIGIFHVPYMNYRSAMKFT